MIKFESDGNWTKRGNGKAGFARHGFARTDAAINDASQMMVLMVGGRPLRLAIRVDDELQDRSYWKPLVF